MRTNTPPVIETPPDLESVLAEVSRDLGILLKSEVAGLAKGDDDKGNDSGSDAGGSDSGPPSDGGGDSSGPPDSAGGPPDASAGASPPAGGPPGPDASQAPPPDASGAPADASSGAPPDPAAIKAEFDTMPVEQVKAYFVAAKQSLLARMQGAQGPGAGAPPAGPDASASAGAPPPPGAGAPPPGASASVGAPPPGASSAGPPPPAMKAEIAASPGNGGKPAPVQKSERDVEVDDLKTKVGLLAKALDLSLRPQRKAITGISAIGKPGEKSPGVPETPAAPATRAQALAKFNDQSFISKLNKSERDQVTKFCVGSVDVKAIEHLLAK